MKMPFPNVTSIKSVMQALPVNKSCGLDGVRIKAIRHNEDIVHIITQCLKSFVKNGIYPDSLKISLVRPIFKKGCHTNVSDYRYISLLSVIDKIYEKYLNNELMNFLEEHSILTPHQKGFRRNMSTSDATDDFLDYAYENVDINCFVLCCFIDWAKAFDTMGKAEILCALERCGVRGPLLKLFDCYLTNRSILIKLKSTLGQIYTVDCGVPQGSVLGPTLFIILANSMPSVFQYAKVDLFADDTVLKVSSMFLNTAVTQLQDDLFRLQLWAHDNGTTINVSKTKIMCVHSPQKRVDETIINIRLHNVTCLHMQIDSYTIARRYIECDCPTLEIVDEYVYLGITIDSKLLFRTHVLKVIRKLRVVLLYMYRLQALHFPMKIIKQVYYSLADSHLNYCITSWGSMAVTNLNALEYLQNKMIRVLHPVPTVSTKEKFKALNILPIKTMYEYRLLLKHYFKPDYRILVLRNVNTRLAQTELYMEKIICTRYGERCRAYRVPHLLNSLPIALRHINSYGTLKRELRSYLLAKL
jgi:hypothetical protein